MTNLIQNIKEWYKSKFPIKVYCRWNAKEFIEENKAIDNGWKQIGDYWYCSSHK